MLQFIAKKSDKYSIAEQVQMALEAGCQWIELDMGHSTTDEARAEAMEVMPLCQESAAFFVLDHNVELTSELHIHGVHLSEGDMSPFEAREVLGPEAVIGISATSAAQVIKYRTADIDYAQVRPDGLPAHDAIDRYAELVLAVAQSGCEIHIVAEGGVTIDDIPRLVMSGVAGIAISESALEADDPVAYLREALARCAR